MSSVAEPRLANPAAEPPNGVRCGGHVGHPPVQPPGSRGHPLPRTGRVEDMQVIRVGGQPHLRAVRRARDGSTAGARSPAGRRPAGRRRGARGRATRPPRRWPRSGPSLEREVLGAHADDDRTQARSCTASATGPGSGMRPPGTSTATPSGSCTTVPVMVFIGGLPMKRATKRFAGCSYTAWGGPTCCSTPFVHDGDAVTHRHRLDLVVGDVDERGRQPPVQLDELGARLHAQLGVEVRERLVHEEDLAGGARWRAPAPPAGAGRPRAARACGRAARRGRACARPRRRSRARSSLGTLRDRSGNSMFRCTVMWG